MEKENPQPWKPEDGVGSFPIRQDITVLPSDPPNQIKIGWVIYEIPPNQTEIEHMRSVLSPEQFQEWLHESSFERNRETDQADKYRTHHAELYEQPQNIGYTSIEVLGFLKGEPWNNLALRFIQALRPSAIRASSGALTCDAMTWRVTVFLENDNVTIYKITQEVQIEAVGLRGSRDLWEQLEYQKEHKTLDGFKQTEGGCVCIVNDAALERVNFK